MAFSLFNAVEGSECTTHVLGLGLLDFTTSFCKQTIGLGRVSQEWFQRKYLKKSSYWTSLFRVHEVYYIIIVSHWLASQEKQYGALHTLL